MMMDSHVPSRIPGALVIGGDYRGLGLVRSLGRHGIPVCVFTDEHTLAGLSRFATKSLDWPGTAEEQLSILLELGARSGYEGWALFPTSDETAALLARNHSSLADKFVITTPPWEVLRWAYDKRLTYRLAAELEVAYPLTLYPRSRKHLESFDLQFPMILKPAVKHEPSRFTHEKAWRVENLQQAIQRYGDACSMIERSAIMLQELIPGDGACQYSYAALCADGLPLASIVALRRRQYPIEFGHASTYVESVEEPEVERLARKVLGAMKLTGLVEVEFKRDSRDGAFKLLDINPRVWGWHTLGAAAGVDFGYLTWRYFNGAEIIGKRGQPGVRWMRATTDLLALMQYVRRSDFSLGDYWRSLRGPLTHAIYAKDDPWPAVCEIPALLRARRRYMRQVAHLESGAPVTANTDKAI